MSAPSPEILNDINSLVSTVTGFKANQDNFAACKKYCVSHFMHHSYPSISKTTVKSALSQYEERFYVQAKFELSKALNEQVEAFLSHEETFKNNPECQIEWNVLSLIVSLSANLSYLFEVPLLEALNDGNIPSDNFDWGSFLKEGLPVYQCDTDSDSFSSLSSTSSENLHEEKSTSNFMSVVEEISANLTEQLQTPSEIQSQRNDYLERLKKRQDDLNIDSDIARRGYLASQWMDLNAKVEGEACLMFIKSEKEAVEKIIHCLVSGENFDDLTNSTTSFLSKDAFSSFLKTLEPYVSTINEFKTFINRNESNIECDSVVVRTYASCLQHYLMQFELKMLDINYQNLTLIQLLEPIQPCFPFILGLASTHKSCISGWGNEPIHLTSLRIIGTLFNSMIESHREDLRSAFLGMFLSCFAVYGDIINELFTSATDVDRHQEFFIKRHVSQDNTECEFVIPPDCKRLLSEFPIADSIANKVTKSSVSLSLLYILNQQQYRNDKQDLIFINEYLYNALEITYKGGEVETEEIENNVHTAMAKLACQSGNLKTFDFMLVPRWVEKSECPIPVHKVICNTLIKAIEEKLEQMQNYAISILVDEMCVERHLNMLRKVMLFNDASILLPFISVYFNEESSWANNDYLTFLLRECISTEYPDLAENISVFVTCENSTCHQNIIEAIDSINILYEVPYPINLVLSGDIMKKYNAIFRVLLKVKWSHTLVNLPFPSKNKEFTPAAQYVLHRLQILRFSCLADLNVIQNYFMAQVAASLPSCSEYTDIQTLINDHESLIERMYARCMLSDGDQYHNLIFDSVMPLCFNLRSTWYLHENQIVATLRQMENVFRTSHAKLQRIMVSLEKETYQPLLAKLENTTCATNYTAQYSIVRSYK